ncbi:MAG TPA: hypothetical protein VJM53_04510 [Burkholderiales bacterium]|jgi:hypothetical protein|nr:hypothetical protein [Burkholderiales bacterium]
MARIADQSVTQDADQPATQDETHIVERPDGFYWQSDVTGEEYGPFKTLEEAAADMEFAAPEDDYEEPLADSLEEAEAELGVGYIDPTTGETNETGAPRLDEDH